MVKRKMNEKLQGKAICHDCKKGFLANLLNGKNPECPYCHRHNTEITLNCSSWVNCAFNASRRKTLRKRIKGKKRQKRGLEVNLFLCFSEFPFDCWKA